MSTTLTCSIRFGENCWWIASSFYLFFWALSICSQKKCDTHSYRSKSRTDHNIHIWLCMASTLIPGIWITYWTAKKHQWKWHVGLDSSHKKKKKKKKISVKKPYNRFLMCNKTRFGKLVMLVCINKWTVLQEL